MNWQFHWPSWYHLYPYIKVYPANEDGPKELVVCFSIFQFRKWVWHK